MRRLAVVLLAALVAVAMSTSARGASAVSYGIQDDAWLQFGPGTVDQRVATLKRLGLRVARVTVHWDQVERQRDTFDWTAPDSVLDALLTAGIQPVVTLYGTPRWANGGREPNVAPTLSNCVGSRFSGNCRPCSARNRGFGSKVSRWLTPPHMKSEITFFARGLKCGCLGENGEVTPGIFSQPAARRPS